MSALRDEALWSSLRWGDTAVGGRVAGAAERARSASEVEQVGAFGVVEPQSAALS
jgi:hypothetical protein